MAIQDQGQGQIQEVVGVLRRRAWQILLPAAFTIVLGVCVARLLPRKFTTKTGIELREVTLPVGGEGYDAKSLQRDFGSTTWQIKQVERVRRVVERLEWPDYTALKPQDQHEYVRDMIDRIKVVPTAAKNNQGSSLIEIEYTDSDPQRAEQFLNRLRETYTSEVLERVRSDARLALDVMQNARKDALNTLDARQSEATDLKKQKGVSATQQSPAGGRQRDEDPVFLQLSDSERSLANQKVSLAADQAQLALLKQQYDETPVTIEREKLSEGTTFDKQFEDIDKEIEALRETQKGIRPAHSVYQDAELKISRLEEKREALKERQSKPATEMDMVHNPRRDDLSKQMQAKELDIKKGQALQTQLETNIADLTKKQADRAEIFLEIQRLDDETEIARKNYQAASDAFNRQKRFVDQITQGYSNPFEVTELARTPNSPTWPNQPIIIGAAAVLGLAIGLISSLIAEFGRGAFRGVADVSRALSAPVLGLVNEIVTERQTARLRTRRFLIATSTFALMAAMLWVTWAFEHRPRWLGSNLTQAIENVREMFR